MKNINLNQYIDQTLLKADAKFQDIEKIILEAKKYNFKAVCINPFYVKFAYENLKNTNIKVCTVIGFPLGANTIKTKIFEAQQAIADGADEIDVVINIAALKNNQQDYVLQELKQIKEVCNKKTILKVIIETALLTETEKIIACKIVNEVDADFIKTSTGFASSGAVVEDILLFKKYLKENIGIKASGGIKNQAQAISLINAGATRIGTSNGVNIVINKDISSNDNKY